MKFSIGDTVIISASGEKGTVEDVLLSKGDGSLYYEINGTFYDPDDLEPANEVSYRYDVFTADNSVVVAVLYERVNDKETEVARGHGHIMHSGVVGYAQAASYALKKILCNINDGELIVNNNMKGNYYGNC